MLPEAASQVAKPKRFPKFGFLSSTGAIKTYKPVCLPRAKPIAIRLVARLCLSILRFARQVPGRISKKVQPKTTRLVQKPITMKTWGCVRFLAPWR